MVGVITKPRSAPETMASTVIICLPTRGEGQKRLDRLAQSQGRDNGGESGCQDGEDNDIGEAPCHYPAQLDPGNTNQIFFHSNPAANEKLRCKDGLARRSGYE